MVASEALAALNAAAMLARSRCGGRVPVLGLAGPQGSGKSTLANAVAEAGPNVAQFSLDDVYLPAAERRDLAARVHPLFATRGVPGTHDMELLNSTLDRLQAAGDGGGVPLPAFDKVTDDRLPQARWPLFEGRPSLILVEGWCLGATAQADEALLEPINALEAQEDRLGRWRSYANAQLEGPYAEAFARVDALVYLRAPSFAVIEGWRGQQEAGLLGRPLNDDDRARIKRFVAHFERITQHMLDGGHTADVVVQLDEGRGVADVSRRGGP